MKQSGITRRIDELGRIVIPKEIRKNLGIRDGENLEIYVSDEGIYLKKHFQIHKYKDIASKLCDIASNIINGDCIVTDREKIIAANEKIAILNQKKINKKLINLIDNRVNYISEISEELTIEEEKIKGFFTIIPIISSIDSIGLVIIKCDNKQNYEIIAKIISRILSEKIDIC